MRDELIDQSATLRFEAWGCFGPVDDHVLTHIINPTLMGGPRWPAMRQAYRVARGTRGQLLASEGLSDPFDDEPANVNGLGLELYAITSEPLDQLPGTWFWDMVWQISNFAAGHGGVRPLLDELGLVSTELYDVSIPSAYRSRFVNDAERIGVLLGLHDIDVPASIAGPLSEIRLTNVKLLTLSELDYVVRGGEQARASLADALAAQGEATSSSLDRESVF